MGPGAKPKPTELKRLAGNPGKRPLNNNEPQFASGDTMTCPAFLDKVARREFKRVLRAYTGLGLMKNVDRGALAVMCQLYSRAVQAEREIAEYGLTITTTLGNVIQNPAIGIANRCYDTYIKIATEFGMTPSSRSRLQVAPTEDTRSLGDKLRAGDVQLLELPNEVQHG